jgi:hypothetical protein
MARDGRDHDASREPFRRTARRLGWFVLLWAGGVAAVGLLAMVLRLVVPA